MQYRKMTRARNEETYFSWLCHQIHAKNTHQKELAFLLHQIPFSGLIPNDDNRAEDGLILREVFTDEKELDISMIDPECSVLEMLIALAKRIEYIIEDPTSNEDMVTWFWRMLDNLGLETNQVTSLQKNEEIIENFLRRDISPKGHGGLFPLSRSRRDQRKVEIWYQLMAYLDENYAII